MFAWWTSNRTRVGSNLNAVSRRCQSQAEAQITISIIAKGECLTPWINKRLARVQPTGQLCVFLFVCTQPTLTTQYKGTILSSLHWKVSCQSSESERYFHFVMPMVDFCRWNWMNNPVTSPYFRLNSEKRMALHAIWNIAHPKRVPTETFKCVVRMGWHHDSCRWHTNFYSRFEPADEVKWVHSLRRLLRHAQLVNEYHACQRWTPIPSRGTDIHGTLHLEWERRRALKVVHSDNGPQFPSHCFA